MASAMGNSILMKISEMDQCLDLLPDDTATRARASRQYNEIAFWCQQQPACVSLTTWEHADEYSWLNNPDWHPASHTRKPLVFEGPAYSKKLQFYGVLNGLQGVLNPTAPIMTAQPLPVSISVGETAKFSVAASGSGLTYQWMGRAYHMRSYSAIPGANSATYTTPPATLGNNFGVYYCVLANGGGIVNSTAVMLQVH